MACVSVYLIASLPAKISFGCLSQAWVVRVSLSQLKTRPEFFGHFGSRLSPLMHLPFQPIFVEEEAFFEAKLKYFKIVSLTRHSCPKKQRLSFKMFSPDLLFHTVICHVKELYTPHQIKLFLLQTANLEVKF